MLTTLSPMAREKRKNAGARLPDLVDAEVSNDEDRADKAAEKKIKRSRRGQPKASQSRKVQSLWDADDDDDDKSAQKTDKTGSVASAAPSTAVAAAKTAKIKPSSVLARGGDLAMSPAITSIGCKPQSSVKKSATPHQNHTAVSDSEDEEIAGPQTNADPGYLGDTAEEDSEEDEEEVATSPPSIKPAKPARTKKAGSPGVPAVRGVINFYHSNPRYSKHGYKHGAVPTTADIRLLLPSALPSATVDIVPRALEEGNNLRKLVTMLSTRSSTFNTYIRRSVRKLVVSHLELGTTRDGQDVEWRKGNGGNEKSAITIVEDLNPLIDRAVAQVLLVGRNPTVGGFSLPPPKNGKVSISDPRWAAMRNTALNIVALAMSAIHFSLDSPSNPGIKFDRIRYSDVHELAWQRFQYIETRTNASGQNLLEALVQRVYTADRLVSGEQPDNGSLSESSAAPSSEYGMEEWGEDDRD
ncbi:hypothetical protein JCM11641_002330 [Rhodosporidiobolus odoratus]